MYEITHSNECLSPELADLRSKVSLSTYRYCKSCFNHTIITHDQFCDHQWQFVKYHISGGRIQVREQCKICKKLDPKNHKFPLPAVFAKLPDAVPVPESDWEAIKEERDRFIAWLSEKKRTNFFAQHDKYLQTPEWKTIRAAVLKRDNYTCQGCLIVTATQVHHLHYQRWKKEMAFDLISLCSACHNKIHGL